MGVKDKAKKLAVEGLTVATLVGGGMSASAGNSNGENFNSEPQAKVIVDKNYKKSITVYNDTTLMVGGTKAYYAPKDGNIYVMKGELSFSDVFDNYKEDYVDEEALLIHERQHQINDSKRMDGSVVSLNEHYQRCTHDEITAYMAELLEVRRRYKEVKTEEDKQAFLKSFCQDNRYVEYLNAIKDGVVNPRSESKEDFLKEMSFIKNIAIDKYDNDGSGYTCKHIDMVRAYLSENGDNIRSNSEAFKKEIEAMYNIGGFDFNTVGGDKAYIMYNPDAKGRDEFYVIHNSALETADKFLEQGVDVKKVDEFIRCCGENFDVFEKIEKMDFSGLSKEQVSKIVQTVLVVDDLKQNIEEDLVIRGKEPDYDFDYVARNLRQPAASYMQAKIDLLEKNGELSSEGNIDKFNQLMEEAKKVDIKINLDDYDLSFRERLSEELGNRLEKYDGKTVNFDEVVVNKDDMTLPLDDISYQEVMDKLHQQDEEDKKFLEDYYKNNPKEKGDNRKLSLPYEVEITDYNSDILKDELGAREKVEQEKQKEVAKKLEPKVVSVRPLHAPYKEVQEYKQMDGYGLVFKHKSYNNVEIKNNKNTDGTSTEVTFIDGKKHGAEVTYNPDGSVKEFKLYDHGKEINLKNHELNIVKQENEQGTREVIMLDGKPFGTEKIIDKDGNIYAGFYEKGGMVINTGENSKISEISTNFMSDSTQKVDTKETQSKSSETSEVKYTDEERADLHSFLPEQKGEYPLNPYAKLKEIHWDTAFTKHLNNQSNNAESKSFVLNNPFGKSRG